MAKKTETPRGSDQSKQRGMINLNDGMITTGKMDVGNGSLLSDSELERIAVKFNSSGQYGTMKVIHKALVYYNKYLKGEIQKDEL